MSIPFCVHTAPNTSSHIQSHFAQQRLRETTILMGRSTERYHNLHIVSAFFFHFFFSFFWRKKWKRRTIFFFAPFLHFNLFSLRSFFRVLYDLLTVSCTPTRNVGHENTTTTKIPEKEKQNVYKSSEMDMKEMEMLRESKTHSHPSHDMAWHGMA